MAWSCDTTFHDFDADCCGRQSWAKRVLTLSARAERHRNSVCSSQQVRENKQKQHDFNAPSFSLSWVTFRFEHIGADVGAGAASRQGPDRAQVRQAQADTMRPKMQGPGRHCIGPIGHIVGHWVGMCRHSQSQAGRQVAACTTHLTATTQVIPVASHHPPPPHCHTTTGRPRQTRQAQAGPGRLRQVQASRPRQTCRRRQTGSGRLRPGLGRHRHTRSPGRLRQGKLKTTPSAKKPSKPRGAKSFKKKALNDEASKKAKPQN